MHGDKSYKLKMADQKDRSKSIERKQNFGITHSPSRLHLPSARPLPQPGILRYRCLPTAD